MRRTGFIVAGLLVLTAPALVGDAGTVRDDPLEEVVQALGQGRHWYASRLLRNLDRDDRRSPEASLLAARADAGRRSWAAVVRRLQTVSWLDSIGLGEGRALLAQAQLETGQPEAAVENYRKFLDYSIEIEPRALAEVGLARALAELGRGREASAAYARAAESIPQLGPWMAMRAAESLASLGDTAAVRVHLSRAREASLYRRTVTMVTALDSAGDQDGALRVLLDAADAPGASRYTADLRARVAQILLEQGDTAAARGTLRTVVSVHPGSARSAAELLAKLPGLDATDYQKLAVAFEKSGAPLSAANNYRRYLDLVQVSLPEQQKLRLKIGELLFRGRSYFAAVEELEQVAASQPAPSVRARAEYVAARATYRRGWRREGRARLRDIADRYPGTGSALNSLSLLGDLYESAGNVAEAREIYEEIVARYAGSRTAPRIRYRLGILAFMERDYPAARLQFDRLRRTGGWSELKIQATYWAARVREAEGTPERKAEAKRLYQIIHSRDPFGYYGFLAAERVGIDPWAGLTPGPEPSAIDAATQRKFDLMDLLRRAGLDAEAGAVLDDILAAKSNRPEDLLGLSQALAQNGYGLDAVKLGWRAHARLRGIWSASVLKAVYPLAFEDIIIAEASYRNLDPPLVAAVARQESAFEPEVVSRAGARGLLQLMPATGRWWAGRVGIRDYSDELLFHPETNVHLGTAYLADLQRRYDDLQVSLIAYNAGPTRARRWRQRPEYRIDPELFAERIPFSETRTYVKNVQAHYRIYRNLYSTLRASDSAD